MDLAGERQAAAGQKIHLAHLGDGGGDPDARQSLLQHRQGLGLVPHPHLDQALGGKAESRQTWGIEIGPPHGPHHRPPVR